MHDRLNQRIKACEAKLGKKTALLSRLILSICLFVLYTIMSLVHVWDVLFLPPQTSFQRLSQFQEDKGYLSSYSYHRRWKHNVRFGTVSYSLVMVTAVVFVAIFIQLTNTEKYTPTAYAAALIVNTANDIDDGACNPAHCSLREAIKYGNPGDVVGFTGSFTITPVPGALLPMITDNNFTIDSGGNTIIIDCNNNISQALRINADNVKIKGVTVRKCTQDGITVTAGADNFELIKVAAYNNQHGVQVHDGVAGKIIEGAFENNTENGVFVHARSNMTITKNNFENNGLNGLSVSTSGSTITQNWASANKNGFSFNNVV